MMYCARFISHRYDNEYIYVHVERERERIVTMIKTSASMFRSYGRFSFCLILYFRHSFSCSSLSIVERNIEWERRDRATIIGPFFSLIFVDRQRHREEEKRERENGQLNREESVYTYSVDAAAERLCSSTSWLWYQFFYSSSLRDIKLRHYFFHHFTGIKRHSGMNNKSFLSSESRFHTRLN